MIDIKKVRMLYRSFAFLRMDNSESMNKSEPQESYELISDDLLPDIEIDGIVLKNVGSFCPEQYFAYKDGKEIGYLRLRWGRFTVDYYSENGDYYLITQLTYKNQPYKGRFTEEERLEKLTRAVQALNDYHKKINAEVKE